MCCCCCFSVCLFFVVVVVVFFCLFFCVFLLLLLLLLLLYGVVLFFFFFFLFTNLRTGMVGSKGAPILRVYTVYFKQKQCMSTEEAICTNISEQCYCKYSF